MKSLIKWFVEKVLWPVLRYILAEILQEFVKWLVQKLKDALTKWRHEEEGEAASEDAKEAVRKKYDRREADLDRITREAPQELAKIVEEAMKRWENQRDLLLAGGDGKSELPPKV